MTPETGGLALQVPPLYTALLKHHRIDLATRSGNPAWLLPVPATFLVAPSGLIRESWVDIEPG